ncbi:helix-turn-helix transcriptional regulator [Aliiglaciecola sp. SL4]|uniref:helix-turn-helix transcriptional regulator n=1 Tax=Aliiglaciecola sp. SL4 TaxID=3239806 RepID=UPI00355BBEA9
MFQNSNFKAVMLIKEIVSNLGERLKQARLNADLTQQDIADKTGLSRKVIMRAEKGHAQLETVVAILVALGLSKQLDLFIPIATESPVQLAKRQGQKRQRASGNNPQLKKGDPAW